MSPKQQYYLVKTYGKSFEKPMPSGVVAALIFIIGLGLVAIEVLGS